MTLYIIGIGLYDESDVTLRGLEIIKKCDLVFLEYYTSKLGCSVESLEKLYQKKIILLDRKGVEEDKVFLKEAKDKEVALLIIGDPFSATTHTEILLESKNLGINCVVINNASVLTAIGVTGLQLYKFGMTTSIPFEEKSFVPETPYTVLLKNKKAKLHTLFLLDLRPYENRFMTINDAIKFLLKIESLRKRRVINRKTLCVGCARLGSVSPTIKSGPASSLLNFDFGPPPHCLIIPGALHFVEKDSLKLYS